jgi:hypothetical protein
MNASALGVRTFPGDGSEKNPFRITYMEYDRILSLIEHWEEKYEEALRFYDDATAVRAAGRAALLAEFPQLYDDCCLRVIGR